jgi:hypothetical protein
MRRAIIYLLLFFTLPVYAQVNFQFIPEMYGRNVEGLFNCRILNGPTRRTATLSIVVSERKAGTVVLIKTAPFAILPGSNVVPYSAIRGASIQYSSNNIGVINNNHNYFPQGTYEYCFTLNFNDNKSDALAEQCFDYQLTPFAELNLIDPYNKDNICDTRPVLTWQPLLPGIAGSYYQLVLSEIKTGQTPVEALNYNLPIINQSNITATVLPYPSIVKELEKGKSYVWQVTAYKNQTVLNRSEVWQFKVDCKDTTKKELTDDGYRDIEDLVKGNFYVANGVVRFAVVNAYGPQTLKYEIKSLHETDKKIKGLPKVKLTRGSNKIIIDLSSVGALVDANFYVMNIWLPNGSVKSLRFIYYDKD